jgi:hypothetical protein
MTTWKIQNISEAPVKVSMILSSTTSKGLILKPHEFCIAAPHATSSMGMQATRKLINVDKTFDNSEFKFDMGVAINESVLEQAKLSKLEKAKKDAEEYVGKK